MQLTIQATTTHRGMYKISDRIIVAKTKLSLKNFTANYCRYKYNFRNEKIYLLQFFILLK